MARKSFAVRGEILYNDTSGNVIALETPQWYAWLTDPSHKTFRFDGLHGHFSARAEAVHGGRYWYAYRRVNGTLRKMYIGRSEEMTLTRLNTVASEISATRNEDISVSEMQPLRDHFLPAQTKFHPPYVRTALVHRARLLQQLAYVQNHALTLICAPTGYGKTTLVCEWLEKVDSPLIWVSLDEHDDDALHFWLLLVTAFEIHFPVQYASLLQLLRSPQPLPQQVILTALINAFSNVQRDTLLIFDDYHTIKTPAIHEGIDYLLQHLPRHLHLVLLSRVEPPLALARLRAQQRLLELRADDLRFAYAEAEQFLHQMGLRLLEQDMNTLQERTEGWIAGLQLAALSLRSTHHTATALTSSQIDQHYTREYLMQEVLQQQPAYLQDFLLTTSLLDRFTANLCDAVRGSDDSQSLLAEVEQLNLFLIPLDTERRWYRYHHLFADMLRSYQRRHAPHYDALREQIYRQASLWCVQEKLFVEAIEYAFIAPDYEQVATLLQEVAEELMLVRGEVTRVRNWFATLPATIFQARPYLCVLRALAALLLLAGEECRAYLHLAEEGASTATDTSLQGKVAVLQGMLAHSHGDIDATINFSHQALALLPTAEHTLWHCFVAMNLGASFDAKGELDAAGRSYLQALTTSRVLGFHYFTLYALYNLALVRRGQGLLPAAQDLCRQAIQLMTQLGISHNAILAPLHLEYGSMLYEHNDLASAAYLFQQAVEISKQTKNMFDLALSFIALAYTASAHKRHVEALKLIDDALNIAQSLESPQTQSMIAAYHSDILLMLNQTERAAYWARRYEKERQSSFIQTDIQETELLILSKVSIFQQRYDLALQLLESYLSQTRKSVKQEERIGISLLQAMAFYGQRRLDEALQTLQHALSLAEPGRYIRTFIDQGPLLIALLKEALCASQNGPLPSGDLLPGWYIQQILTVSEETSAKDNPPSNHLDPTGDYSELLSARELEVLQLLASGLSNQEIADHLIIAISTVKTHIKRIYNKLDVSTRLQAVTKARSLALLS